MNKKTDFLNDSQVEWVKTSLGYPKKPPFSPSKKYPEYQFDDFSTETNNVYASVRQLFYKLGFDKVNFNKPNWNPLGHLIKPGYKVLLKPNWVTHKPGSGGDKEALTTNSSIIRAIIDYVIIALKGQGLILVADSPIQTADFSIIKKQLNLEELERYYHKNTSIPVLFSDLRDRRAVKLPGSFIWKYQIQSQPKPVLVNLKNKSLFSGMDSQKLRVSNYPAERTALYHAQNRHIYSIARAALCSDVIINLPKLKTHKLNGLTACMKNMVGILVDKSCLPHYTEGDTNSGGDQTPNYRFIFKIYQTLNKIENSNLHITIRFISFIFGRAITYLFKKLFIVSEGNWWKNNTVWRMVWDLAYICIFADSFGRLHQKPVRRYLNIVDAVVSGEGNGPLRPMSIKTGLIIAGINPWVVDSVCAYVAGFNSDKLKYLKNPLKEFSNKIAPRFLEKYFSIPHFKFIPSDNWKGHIESDNYETG